MRYLVGIDVGTTGTKTILTDERGNLVASSLEEYPLHTPRPKWSEQDPADWWRATVNSIKQADNVLVDSRTTAIFWESFMSLPMRISSSEAS